MSESVFTYGAPGLKFGPGASDEIGWDLLQTGARRVLLVTDPGVAATGHPARIAERIAERGLEVTTYDGTRVEPTDASLEEAVTFARGSGPYDAVVAVGGGSVIDTAKAVDLLLTNPGELMDYVNAPVGGGRAPEHPLLPLVAVPTTTGTGSESTTICVLDVHDSHYSAAAPSGRWEDFHGVHLVFAATVAGDVEPRVVEAGGTTDDVAWVPLAAIESGDVEVLDLVAHALRLGERLA